MKNSLFKKVIAMVLSISMLICMTGTIFAQTSTQSQTVYVLLDENGTPRQTIVSSDGEQQKDVTGELPYSVKISYMLGGESTPAKDMVSKSGDVKITIEIAPNDNTKKYYKENLALQMQFPINMANGGASEIVAEGLTAVTVGQTQTLSAIVLPGKSAKYEISYKTESFSQQSVNFICMPFDMTGTIDIDMSAVGTQVKQLQNGLTQYVDGVSKASDGITKASDGVKTLAQNGSQLSKGYAQTSAGELQLIEAMLASMPAQQQAAFAQQVEMIKAAQKQMGDSINSYVGGVSSASAGLEQASGGTAVLAKSGVVLKDGVNKAVAPLEELTAKAPEKGEPESFISSDKVSQIQFVMKTDAVTSKQIKADVVPAVKPKESFWRRLLALFGL
ncbi:MAG: hypothetical protein RR036_02910 [Oscillospiraceae bacterium]